MTFPLFFYDCSECCNEHPHTQVFVTPLFFFRFCFWLRWVFDTVWAFSSCGEGGYSLVAVQELFVVVASLVEEHGR